MTCSVVLSITHCGYEGSVRAMGAHGAEAAGDLVVHQHGERAVAVVVGAEAVGDAGHLVAADRVAGGQQRTRW